MSYRRIPECLKERVREYGDYKWREIRGIEEETLLRSLPEDLRKDIECHLFCLDMLKKVPWFKAMDDQLLDILCSRLKRAHYTKDSYIVREGEPLKDMLFIVSGDVISTTTYGGKTDGDICGDLLAWLLDPQSSESSDSPISSRTVQALTDVECFLLSADDIKLSTQYCHVQCKELQHLIRYYSVQERTRAACRIQEAWRRHYRKKLSKALREEEEEGKLHNTLLNDGSGGNKLNLKTAIYASRFVSHTLGNLKAKCSSRKL